MEADIIRAGHKFKHHFDWLRDISGSHFLLVISLDQSEAGLAVTSCICPLNNNAINLERIFMD